MKFVYCKIIVFSTFLLFLQNVSARPTRVKRVSDQRLAELETLLALTKMSGRLVTVPVGFGKFDPNIVGRRRRSESGLMERLYIFNDSQEDPEEEAERPYNEELDRLFNED